MSIVKQIQLRSVDPVQEASGVRETLQNHSVVHIQPGWHIPDLRGFYDTFTEHLGDCVNIGEDFTQGGVATGEKWLEIRYDDDIPDMAAFRHSKNPQPLHTDESYISDPSDIMFFYCVNRAVSGGATTFVHGCDIVNRLQQEQPELLERLLNDEVTYKKAEEQRCQPIISQNDGQYILNFNYFCIDKNETEEASILNEQFYQFLQTHIVGSDLIEEVLLEPGEAVAWWDTQVLHGRNSFNAQKTNDRFIWKTGIRAA